MTEAEQHLRQLEAAHPARAENFLRNAKHLLHPDDVAAYDELAARRVPATEAAPQVRDLIRDRGDARNLEGLLDHYHPERVARFLQDASGLTPQDKVAFDNMRKGPDGVPAATAAAWLRDTRARNEAAGHGK
jgi:hypothetical protein